MRVLGITTILCFLASTSSSTSSSFINSADQSRLTGIFQDALATASDAATLHYAAKGLQALGAATGMTACSKVEASVDTSSVENLFHVTNAGSILGCPPAIPASVLSSAVTSASSLTALYQAVGAAKAAGADIDGPAALTALSALLKKDDSILASGYAFHVAAAIGGDVQKFVDLIEDVFEQADEVDGKFLQFEGGLYTSAIVVDGAFKLAQAAGAQSVAASDKIVKMANYFVSRKNVHHVKSAAAMATVITTLNTNSFVKPVVVRRHSPAAIPTSTRKVVVSVSDLMGGSLGAVNVVADSLVKKGDTNALLSEAKLTPAGGDGTLFELDFSSSSGAKRGFYVLTLSVTKAPVAEGASAGMPLIGNEGAIIDMTVITEVSIENVEIGIADRDQSVAPKTTRVQFPNKVPTMLEVDSQQKVIMKFALNDLNDAAPIKVHQAFVRMTHATSGVDVFFVADVESGTGLYKFDMDVGASAKEFSSQSGKYSMFLVVGDALISNPVAWELVDMHLTFQSDPSPLASHEEQYKAKPEITHMFREPEKRPSQTVSLAFTVLVCVPLLFLVVAWKMLGANVDAIASRCPVPTLIFHLTLGGIFILMYLYWTSLNMFSTLQYLAVLSIGLFLSGHRLLATIAAARKAK